MLKNPLQETAEDRRMAAREGQLDKKTFAQEQVTFTAPVSSDPRVGIIGGGMAGLACALSWDKRGVKSTVFDTGNHGLGRRMGTRMIGPQPLIFDHAAQFFTVNDSRFRELVDGWLERGLVQPWKTSMFSIVRPCWISNLELFNGMWHLSENVKLRGQFDVVVIAHKGSVYLLEWECGVWIPPTPVFTYLKKEGSGSGNPWVPLNFGVGSGIPTPMGGGKCANRLLGSSGLPQIARQMKRLELSSIWPLLAAFEDPLPLGSASTFEGAFVKGVDSVSWMANSSAKLLNSQSDAPHCWTFFSTAAYGKRNKVPQENIPTATTEKVKTGMLEGVEAALSRPKGSLQKPIYSRVQLWAGTCGDWLLGSSVESAALSGMALANHIADYLGSGVCPEEFAVSLHKDFQSLEGHDIGQFPGLESMEKEQVQAYRLTS
ncbi:hypothetical protein KPL70_023791 [Citrus sinensis]|nr:hypothetical protein KPL70_023791 [Citrus sinensis]